MPIEIKELHIKVRVSDNEALPVNSGPTGEYPEIQTEQIINTCVEKVLEILKDKADR